MAIELKSRPALDGLSPPAALRRIVDHSVQQILANAAGIAGGSDEPELIHEMRVGIRRLRSALKLFSRWDDEAASAASTWDECLAGYAAALGEIRDRRIVDTELFPRLAQLGAPVPAMPPGPSQQALAARLRGRDFTLLMLDLQAFAHGPVPQDAPPLRPRAVRRRLARFEARLRAEAADFPAADDSERHRLRKRFKRLRYGIELAGSLLPRKKTRQRLARLKRVQDALGRLNDMAQAQRMFDGLGAAFAAGWAAGQKEALAAAAERAVRRWLADDD
ncbi:CHAD domain-containing protein [Paucibacter sp. R3-3]|uniref:CHAD domain-containing protein n=1 Tax=Roseateles agri TaxID=3098619 RepID=A0ABU5DJD5_9BURK|nr:CHAD domain-containing protein [Paucibacter sp. R3-3]MDY0745212.1 CHAD domain-containing protein [Paucibacter sp. R3-3]